MRARLLLLVALASGVAQNAYAGTAEVAKRLETEKEQCQFMYYLCREASRAIENAGNTPGAGVLAFKNERLAEMHVQDAVEAADAIAAKYPPGKAPACLSAPECGFLANARRGR